MSVSDPWGRPETGRWSSDQGAESRLEDLAQRLAEARLAGEPAPEDLERLVSLLAKSDIDPGDRLTRALEGIARWSEERRGGAAQAPDPQDAPRRQAPQRRAPARTEISPELESKLSEYARSVTGREPMRREERHAQPAAPTPPIASLRSALAEISARQKALDADLAPPQHEADEPDWRDEPRSAPAGRRNEGSRDRGFADDGRSAAYESARDRYEQAFAQSPRRPAPRPGKPAPRASALAQAAAQAAQRSQAQAPSYGQQPTRAPEAAQPQRRPAQQAAAHREPPAPAPSQRRAEASSGARELRAELDRLGRSMAELPNRSEIDKLGREMSALAARLVEDRPARLDGDSLRAIDALVAEVDRMRVEAPSPQLISELTEELHAISGRLDILGPRNSSAIEQLARRIDDVRGELDQFPRISAVEALASNIQTLVSRLDAQDRAAAPTRDAVVGLAGRVQSLDGRIAAIADANAARDDALERINQMIRAELDRLPGADAVSDLGRQIGRLSEDLRARPTVAPALRAVEGLAGKVDAIDGRLADLAQRRAEETGWLADALRDELAAMAARPDAIDELGRQIDKFSAGISKKVEALDGRIVEMADRHAQNAGWIAQSVRDEVASVTRHEALDGFGRQIDEVAGGISRKVEALDGRLAEIADRQAQDAGWLAQSVRDELSAGISKKVEALDGRLAEIADRQAQNAGWIAQSVRDEIAAAPRFEGIDGLGRQIDQFSAGISKKVEALDGRIAEMNDRHAQNAGWIAQSVRDEVASANRSDAIDGLGRQIEELTRGIAAERQNQPIVAVDSLIARIDGLGQRVDLVVDEGRGRDAAFTRIEDSVRAIADQLVTARAPTTGGSVALEAEVARLIERLERNDVRIEDLQAGFDGLADRIERTCSDLGANVAQFAASAARDALEARTPSGRLESDLADALAEMRASSAQSERRAADALDSVRATIERLLDRMENAPAAYAPPQVETVRARPFVQEAEATGDATEAARAAARRALAEIEEERAAAPRFPRVEDGPVFGAAQPSFAPDQPLEPGAGQPRGESVSGGSDPHSTASLIAAARRAGVRQSSAEPAISAATFAAPVEEKSGSPISGALAKIKANRRPLVLLLGATLIVFAALYVASGMSGDPEPAPPPPPAPTSSVAPIDGPKLSELGQAPAADAVAPEAQDDASAAAGPSEPPPSAAPERKAEADSPSAPAAETEAKTADAEAKPAQPDAKAAQPAKPELAAAASQPKPGVSGWKTAEPETTGAINRAADMLPDAIGGPTLRVRAIAGDPAAQLEVADRMLDGRNVDTNPQGAARWLEKAANQGLAPAQHRLGSLFEKGRGVNRDVAEARRWYEQAAASGNVRAMHNLGVIHAEGGLGKPDFGAATVWFRMAAERGLVDSQYNLAVLMARGLGGKRDLVEAYKWFALAAQQGDEDAGKKRDEVGKALGSSIGVAKTAFETFEAKPIDAAANEVTPPPGGWDRVAKGPDGPKPVR